jgi:homoserine kinase
VAGFLAYQAISGVRPPLDDALAFLARGEGHPDNVVPALVGGFVACAGTADGLRHIRLEPPESLNVALCIPEKTVRTDAARRVLPAAYSREDVVFNTSRLAFTMIGLLGGRGDALAIGCGDRVHQPYRGPLIGPVEEAFSAAREAGAVSAFISGSGSTLAAFVLDPAVDPARVAAAMCERFSAAGLPAQPRVAKPESRGAFSTVIAP